ncbi:hypothetical protein SAMN06269185_1231 [Natronoarchaeum philippinense]|uniref:Uncharacterized protein n=1 Tax=Natronoarchaeum philippinense TaxID=558529 RepID=A0A285NB16_NATPI|nr:hypothetical protein [Natronoarchaeum philippinense]SNZ06619.1 hypothetical protein SAMN06269185_1231 [Natronoarchaeum philippinense]
MTATDNSDGAPDEQRCECEQARYPRLALLKRVLRIVALIASIWTALQTP